MTARRSLTDAWDRVHTHASLLMLLIASLAVISWTVALNWALVCLSAASSAGSAAVQATTPGTWTIVAQTGGDLGLTFSLGWTLGTHQGRASSVTGSMQAQIEPLAITQGEFRVPIAAMSTGSVTRDCHMREALGIDYARSHFPAQHVCVNDQVPASGPDSVVFPDIVVTIRGMRPAQSGASGSAPRLTPTQPVDGQVLLELSMHGATHELSAPVRLQLIKPQEVQAQAEFDVKLADFGVVVKMPPLMGVDERIRVKLNLLLAYRSAQ